MSLTSGLVNEGEQAGEKLSDHIGESIPATAVNTLQGILPLLEERDIVIRISLEKKQ